MLAGSVKSVRKLWLQISLPAMLINGRERATSKTKHFSWLARNTFFHSFSLSLYVYISPILSLSDCLKLFNWLFQLQFNFVTTDTGTANWSFLMWNAYKERMQDTTGYWIKYRRKLRPEKARRIREEDESTVHTQLIYHCPLLIWMLDCVRLCVSVWQFAKLQKHAQPSAAARLHSRVLAETS